MRRRFGSYIFFNLIGVISIIVGSLTTSPVLVILGGAYIGFPYMRGWHERPPSELAAWANKTTRELPNQKNVAVALMRWVKDPDAYTEALDGLIDEAIEDKAEEGHCPFLEPADISGTITAEKITAGAIKADPFYPRSDHWRGHTAIDVTSGYRSPRYQQTLIRAIKKAQWEKLDAYVRETKEEERVQRKLASR